MSQQNQSADSLERTHNPGGMIDSKVDLRWNEIRQRQTCRIEVPGKEKTYGTGVIIGPGVILTNWHVVEKHDPSYGKVKVDFDYVKEPDERRVLNPVTYSLDEDYLIAYSPYSSPSLSRNELDFAVLRLPEEAGRERGWCVLSKEAHIFEKGGPLTIHQHPDGDPLKVDYDDFIGWNENRICVRYTTNTKSGSSGSPCFNKRWKLVAIHRIGSSEYNEGIPVHLIRAFLEKNGEWSSLKADEEQPDLFKPNDQLRNFGIQGPIVLDLKDYLSECLAEPSNVEGPTVIDLKDYLPEPFFGREEDVKIVVEGLEKNHRFSIVGHGGIGKTAIAAKSILSLNPELLKDGVVSHNFYREASIEEMALSIVRPFVAVDAIIGKPLESLKTLLARKCPFIYLEGCENAEDKDLVRVRELIGSCPSLITTREKKQLNGPYFHEVDSIDSTPAVNLLCYHAGVEHGNDALKSLCKTLGFVPLALELAGGWIKVNQSSVAELSKILEEEGLTELHLSPRQKRSIPLLLKKTEERLSDIALDIWAVLGLDLHQPISISVLHATLEKPIRKIRKALSELTNLCLLTLCNNFENGIDEKKHYHLKHRLVYSHGRKILRKRLKKSMILNFVKFYESVLLEWQSDRKIINSDRFSQIRPAFENALLLDNEVRGSEYQDFRSDLATLASLNESRGGYECE